MGRVYAVTHEDADASAEVVEGIVLISEVEAKAIFDPGSDTISNAPPYTHA